MVSVVAQNKHTQAGSLSKQELILLYQSFVYIGLRKEVGIFGKERRHRGWGKMTKGMGGGGGVWLSILRHNQFHKMVKRSKVPGYKGLLIY